MAVPTKIHERNVERLRDVHPQLARVVFDVMDHVPVVIVCGWRGEIEQTEAVAAGRSKTPWPTSKHNAMAYGHPQSLAVDMMPYPPDWRDREQLSYFAGYVLGMAEWHDLKLRWGGCWLGDFKVSANKFDDLVHFEMEDPA